MLTTPGKVSIIVASTHCRLPQLPVQKAAVNSPCDETVGRARGPARGWGRCGEIQGALPAVWDIGNMGYQRTMRSHVGRSAAHVNWLTSQVPQGNLERLMRILIYFGGRNVCIHLLGEIVCCAWRVCCTALVRSTRSRAEWSPQGSPSVLGFFSIQEKVNFDTIIIIFHHISCSMISMIYNA